MNYWEYEALISKTDTQIIRGLLTILFQNMIKEK